ncbi:MAG: class I SAM-dependent methyltransferase [Tissierellia bacterium]|nr:class I SAM-dependent methyltransferase [Tissierellia bacterium]
MTNSYNKFASIYDDLMYDIKYDKWKEYIDSIYKKYEIDTKNILEMACGTGSLTKEMSKSYKIIAFDKSESMLVEAYEKLQGIKNVRLLNLDMTDFDLAREFDSVVCACDSINYIQSVDDLLKCFENAYKHLRKEGAFVFDINSEYKLKYIIGNNTFTDEVDNMLYIWQNDFDEEMNMASFNINYFVEIDDGIYERFTEVHEEKVYSVETIIDTLKKAGFEKIDSYDEFTFDEANEKTKRINFVAIK